MFKEGDISSAGTLHFPGVKMSLRVSTRPLPAAGLNEVLLRTCHPLSAIWLKGVLALSARELGSRSLFLKMFLKKKAGGCHCLSGG